MELLQHSSSSRGAIYLVGHESQQILGAKLPSNRQILSALFYNLRVLKWNLRDSCQLSIQETRIFWIKAQIPTKQEIHCTEKLIKLHAKWRNLQKSSSRENDAQKCNENEFCDQLDNLFDIAYADALTLIKREDRQFLLAQRMPGRHGSLGGIDRKGAVKQKRKAQRQEEEETRKRKCTEALRPRENTVLSTSSSDPQGMRTPDSDFEMQLPNRPRAREQPNRTSAKINFINSRVVAALDSYKIADRAAVHIIIAVAEALGHSIENLIINRSTIQRVRKSNRELTANESKDSFQVCINCSQFRKNIMKSSYY